MAARQSISTQLLKSVLVIYFILTCLITVVHVAVDFFHTEKTILEELAKVEKTFAPTLEEILWRMDEKQLAIVTKSIYTLPVVTGIIITDSREEPVAKLGKTKAANKFGNRLQHRFILKHPFGNEDMHLGDVVFFTDEWIILDRVKDKATFLL